MEDEFIRLFKFIVHFTSRAGQLGLANRKYTAAFAGWSAQIPEWIISEATEESLRLTWRRSFELASGPAEALLWEMEAFRVSAIETPLERIDFRRPRDPKRSFLLDAAKTIIESLKDLPGIEDAAKAAVGIVKELLEFLKAHFESLRK